MLVIPLVQAGQAEVDWAKMINDYINEKRSLLLKLWRVIWKPLCIRLGKGVSRGYCAKIDPSVIKRRQPKEHPIPRDLCGK